MLFINCTLKEEHTQFYLYNLRFINMFFMAQVMISS